MSSFHVRYMILAAAASVAAAAVASGDDLKTVSASFTWLKTK